LLQFVIKVILNLEFVCTSFSVDLSLNIHIIWIYEVNATY